jgi:hypothetical protein
MKDGTVFRPAAQNGIGVQVELDRPKAADALRDH